MICIICKQEKKDNYIKIIEDDKIKNIKNDICADCELEIEKNDY